MEDPTLLDHAIGVIRFIPTFVALGLIFTAFSDEQPVLAVESWNGKRGPYPSGLAPQLLGALNGIAWGIVMAVTLICVSAGVYLVQLYVGLDLISFRTAGYSSISLAAAFAMNQFVRTREDIRQSLWYRGWEGL